VYQRHAHAPGAPLPHLALQGSPSISSSSRMMQCPTSAIPYRCAPSQPQGPSTIVLSTSTSTIRVALRGTPPMSPRHQAASEHQWCTGGAPRVHQARLPLPRAVHRSAHQHQHQPGLPRGYVRPCSPSPMMPPLSPTWVQAGGVPLLEGCFPQAVAEAGEGGPAPAGGQGGRVQVGITCNALNSVFRSSLIVLETFVVAKAEEGG